MCTGERSAHKEVECFTCLVGTLIDNFPCLSRHALDFKMLVHQAIILRRGNSSTLKCDELAPICTDWASFACNVIGCSSRYPLARSCLWYIPTWGMRVWRRDFGIACQVARWSARLRSGWGGCRDSSGHVDDNCCNACHQHHHRHSNQRHRSSSSHEPREEKYHCTRMVSLSRKHCRCALAIFELVKLHRLVAAHVVTQKAQTQALEQRRSQTVAAAATGP